MKYYRFMGNEELKKLLAGEILENHTEWNLGKGLPKTCKGFCFFDYLHPPEERLKYAFGAMRELYPVCVLFKPAKGTVFREGYGIYAKPAVSGLRPGTGLMLNNQNVLVVREYSLEEYSRNTMHILRIGRPYHGQHEYEWHIDWKVNDEGGLSSLKRNIQN